MQPKLKPPETDRLKLKSDKWLSISFHFCFQIQLAPLHHGWATDPRRPNREARGRFLRSDRHGKAVQVDPMNPILKGPGVKRLKVKSDQLLSEFAFNFSFRRYIKGRYSGGLDAWVYSNPGAQKQLAGLTNEAHTG